MILLNSSTVVIIGGVPNFDLYLLRYAVIIIGALPMLVVFPFFQKKMEKGVIAGAVKG